MPFAAGRFRVAVRIAGEGEDNRKNALQFLLLHEIGHVLSAGCGLVPDRWLQPGKIGSLDSYSFLPLSWRTGPSGQAAPRGPNAFPQQPRLAYYGEACLASEDILPTYRNLLATNFFTLYAALSPDEDFAESFALYVHTELLHKPYFVRSYHDGHLLLQYASQWDEPRFAAKRQLLQCFLPDFATAIRQPFVPLIGVAPLMRRAFLQEDLAPLALALLDRAEAHPQDAHAYLDCSTVLQLTGHRELALAVQAEAMRLQQSYRQPYGGAAPALRLLVIMGPGDLMANTPIEFLLEDSDVAIELLYVSDELAMPASLPPHDLLMVAVAESDASQALLAKLADWLRQRHQPVLNRPEDIASLPRDRVCRRLAPTAGVQMPTTARLPRRQLEQLSTEPGLLPQLLPGAAFPLIVRPLGSHAGHDLEKVDDAEALAAYLGQVGADGFYLAPFVDYRDADGQFRKYRVVPIDGAPFICHHAISSHWMVHYLDAGMHESAPKRAEEAQCMAQFEHGFAVRHRAALAEINQRIGLP